jgi:hypothetical protein
MMNFIGKSILVYAFYKVMQHNNTKDRGKLQLNPGIKKVYRNPEY